MTPEETAAALNENHKSIMQCEAAIAKLRKEIRQCEARMQSATKEAETLERLLVELQEARASLLSPKEDM